MARRIQTEEAAELLGCSPRLVQKLCQTGQLRASKVGSIWTTTVAACGEYLAASKNGNDASPLLTSQQILTQAVPAPPVLMGIYFLIRDGAVVYVGQAVNIHARLLAHAKTKDFDAWHWVACPAPFLETLERKYIDALMPALNNDTITRRSRLMQADEAANHG